MCRASVSALGEQQSDDVGFLNGAHVLLGQHVKLRAPLFAALAIMALARPSALLELHDEGRGRELERVLSAVQRRSEGRLAFDRVDADADAGSSSALLIWSPHHARIQELLPPEDVPGADDAGGEGGGTWLSRARPSGAFIQSAYASGLLCDELSDEPTQTVRFMLTEGNATDAAEADGGVAFHEEDCDAGLSRAHVLALLGRYRRVARQLGCADDGCYEVHAELEFDTQEGSLDEGDMLERHVRHVITLRGS